MRILIYNLFLITSLFFACGKEIPPPTKLPFQPIEKKVYQWFQNQALPNGLLESIEDGNVVSLYDNALASLVFMEYGDYEKAEKIFDFFNQRIHSELKAGVGGFSQLRDRSGAPNNHRWIGDNAWLLIALNNYKKRTSNIRFDTLSYHISQWLIKLQDADGGLFAGYDASGKLLNYKVTEGMIDAFNAVEGYTDFHRNLLNFLQKLRWMGSDKSLVAWPENPPYLYALDLHPWSFLIFENFPDYTLTSANRHLTIRKSTATNKEITGYCFDEDRDAVWFEGTGQMTLAFHFANRTMDRDKYLLEMENCLMISASDSSAAGFPYSSNPGTHYGDGQLWPTAHTKIAISGGAWYLFTKRKFNPFAVGRSKDIPKEDQFWVD
ncbi:MAG: hypothetical protein NBV77_03960 [Bacteroidia bacterium]|nr:hypothetical protein [Bacteroidia bacterium]